MRFSMENAGYSADFVGNVVLLKESELKHWGRQNISVRCRLFLITRKLYPLLDYGAKGYVGYPISIKPNLMHMSRMAGIKDKHIERLATPKEVRLHTYRYTYKRKKK